MKINICDVCKKQDNKITETEKYLRVKGLTQLRLDICPDCKEKKVPADMKEYIRFVYGLDNIEISDSEIALILKR